MAKQLKLPDILKAEGIYAISRELTYVRFTNLSVGAKGEYNGAGVQTKIEGQVQNGRHYSEDGGRLAFFSTVGDFFSHNERSEESLGRRLKNIPVANLQPKEIILEPLPLQLELPQTHRDARKQMQQCIKKEVNKLTKALSTLERFKKLTRDSGLEDGVKMIAELKKDMEGSLARILQAIKTLHDHDSSPDEKMKASKFLSEWNCERVGLDLEDLRKKITNRVLDNLIPRQLWMSNLNGSCDKLNYRVAIIGKTGSGKSSLANYLVGEDHFGVGNSSARVTTRYASKQVEIEGKNINVYDTPGFYDKDGDNKLAIQQTQLAQKDGQEKGFDAFIFVVNYNAEMDAKNIFGVIKRTHGRDIKNYTILVFNRMKGKVEDLINNSPEFKKIYEEVGHRVIGVRCCNWRDLLAEERTQTCRKLLEMMQHISHAHKGKRFETGFMTFFTRMGLK